jgi:hypothetical protein
MGPENKTVETETKICQNCKQEFRIEPEDFAFYKKIKVPPPTWCWLCRTQRRLAFRNERFLYKRQSDFSEKEIFCMYPPASKVRVYENNIWFSDKWEPMEYGQEVDFSRPFLAQLLELFKKVPLFALSVLYGVNSDYSNNFTGYKNCYLVFNGNYSEDCMYGVGIHYAKNSIDNSYLYHCENCYESFWITSSSNIFFSAGCSNSFNLFFCKNCNGCNDCFGCVNLRNKKYHIFNRQYSKEEYRQKLNEFDFGSFAKFLELKKEISSFWRQFPVKYIEGMKNVKVSGDYIYNSKNALNSYILADAENVRFCQYMELPPLKDCYDYSVWGNGAQLVYETVSSGLGLHNVKFCWECWPEVRDAEYSLFCQSSQNIFGCVGIKKKNYCILNKQYSRAEFESLRLKIIEHMNKMPYVDKQGNIYKYGEFLPIEFSPFPYNQTPAQEHFSLSKEEALRKGYYWEDIKEREYLPTISWKELPDHIKEADDSILKEIILCQAWEENNEKALEHNCAKAYRILPQELQFYRHYKLPLPRKCPNSRHFDRIKQRNPLKLWHRRCQCNGATSEKRQETGNQYQNTTLHFHGSKQCPNEFETSYSPERPEIVYCEECYNAEVA